MKDTKRICTLPFHCSGSIVLLFFVSIHLLFPFPVLGFFLESTYPSQGAVKLDRFKYLAEDRFNSPARPTITGNHQYELYFRENSDDQEQDHFFKRRSYGLKVPLGDTRVNLSANNVRSRHHTFYGKDDNSVEMDLDSRYRSVGLDMGNQFFKLGSKFQRNKLVDDTDHFNSWAKVRWPNYIQGWAIRNDRYSEFDGRALHDGEALTIKDNFRLDETLYGGRIESHYYLPELTYRHQEKAIKKYESESPPGENHVQTMDGESEFESWNFRFVNDYPIKPIYREMDYEDDFRINMTNTAGDRIFTFFQQSEWQRRDYRLEWQVTDSTSLTPGYFTRSSQGIGSGFFNASNFDRFFSTLLPANTNAFYEHDSELDGYTLNHRYAGSRWTLNSSLEYYDYDQFFLKVRNVSRLFGFIVVDENQETVNYKKLDIANLRFDGSYHWSDRVDVNFLTRQLIPVEIKEKDETGGTTDDGVAGGGSGQDNDLLDQWGGFRAEIGLKVKF